MNSVTKERFGKKHWNSFVNFLMVHFRFGKSILAKLVETVCQVVPEKETTTILDIGTGSFSFRLFSKIKILSI